MSPSSNSSSSSHHLMMTYSESEKEFIRAYNRKLILMTTLSSVFMAAVLVPTYRGTLNLGCDSAPLDTVQDRLVYTLKHLSLQLVWLIVAQYHVIYHRLNTPALDPTRGYEAHVQCAKNVLTNSVEHGLVFIVSQLIMVTDLAPDMCRRLVPTINLLYVFGRILYLAGYPNNRTFGFVIVNFSIILTVSYNLFQLTGLYM